jgi:hypothetical protein
VKELSAGQNSINRVELAVGTKDEIEEEKERSKSSINSMKDTNVVTMLPCFPVNPAGHKNIKTLLDLYGPMVDLENFVDVNEAFVFGTTSHRQFILWGTDQGEFSDKLIQEG